MRALVPLGEKSSESVPEMVLPYRHIKNRCIRQIGNCIHKNKGISALQAEYAHFSQIL